jgi:hypothetical protein
MAKTKRRAPIEGSFQVLVVPSTDLGPRQCTTPMTVAPADELLRLVGHADDGDVSCASWAFTKQTRKTVCKHLRGLADWIEEQAIPD